MGMLFFFANIGPHCAELLGLVSGIDIVENCEFGTEEVSEMSDFSISNVEGDEILMMPDHSSEPFIVRPPPESRNGVDSRDIEENE